MRLNSALKWLIFLFAPFPAVFWIHGWIHAGVRIIISISSFCDYHFFKPSSVKLHASSPQKAPLLKSAALARCHSQQPRSRVTAAGMKSSGQTIGISPACQAAMLSQVVANRALKGLAGAVTRRLFCRLIKQVDVLHVLVICDAGFPIFHDSINFLL